MLKLSRRKKNACLALAVIATVLGGGSVWAAEHSIAIVESNNYGTAQRNYWTTKNISDGRGADNNTYTFNEDIVLKPNASTDSYINPANSTISFRGIFKDGDNNSVINMNGHRLDVAMNYDKVNKPEELPDLRVDALNLYGLGVTSGNLTIKNVAGMNLTANGDYMTAKSKLTGIYVAGTKSSNDSGKANLSIENADGWENAVKFHAADSGATQVQQGIYVWKNVGTAELNISGMVDVKLTNDADAIEVRGGYNPYYGKGSISAYIGGGLLESANYSANAFGGELYINSKLDSEDNIVETAGSRDVQLKGNAYVADRYQDTGKLAVAFNTKDSYFQGVLANNNGNAWMALKNGATWTNQTVGKEAHGSSLKQFVGGDGTATTGYIFQNDSGKLNLGSYSGYTTIFYAHDNDGTETSHYTAGDTNVTSAKAGSNITLVTNEVDTTNDDTVKKALNALAGKLYYTGATKGENALEGIAAIAEGLTSSSKYLKTSNIYFDEATGQGTTKDNSKQTVTDFTATLTGDNTTDSEYADGGVIADDGSYKFEKASTITTNNAYAINTSKDTVIKADKTLSLTTNGGNGAINTTNKLDIAAGKLSITTTSNKGGLNAGTYQTRATVNITGDVDINASNNNSVYGVLATNADITVKGNVKAEIDGGLGGSNYASVSAISSQGSSYKNYASNVTVNGDVDITADGNGLQANGNGAALTINGGGKITVNDTNAKGYSALRADNGTINMNVALADGKATGGLGKEVVLKGNIAATNGTSDGKASVINLALDTKDSSLEGVSYTTAANNSEINLWLQNGASWTNEVHGATEVDYYTQKNIFTNSNVTRFVGGAGENTAGNIFQKDSNKLTIGSYSGYTNIFYAHEGNGEAEANYTAGDTIITSAAAGSVVNLITDNTNITVDDKSSVANVLNALAGKLTYTNYTTEKNLTGYVKIAEGLTASSQALKTGDITFTDAGKGTYVQPQVQEKSELTTTLTGVAATDTEYEGNIAADDGHYFFTKDSSITTANSSAIGVEANSLTVKADKALTLNVSKTEGTNSLAAINQRQGQTVNITAETLKINAENKAANGDIAAIYVKGLDASPRAALTITGNVEMQTTGKTGYHTIGAYANQADVTINGNVKSTIAAGEGANVYYGAAHLYATGAQGAQSVDYQGGQLVVNGNVDLSGTAQGLFANIGGAVVTVNGGGNIAVTADETTEENSYAAIRAENGTANMNVALDNKGAATKGLGKDVTIAGNVIASVGAVNDVDVKGQLTTVNLALDTKASKLAGAVVNGFDRNNGAGTGVTTDAGNTFTGAINLWLQNGAEWTNELATDLKNYADNKYAAKYQGSHVTNFTGGDSAVNTGYIIQKDDSKLKLDNYSGYTTIFYAHTNDGSEAAHYKDLGDTIVDKAAAGSNITLVTDNKDINTGDSALVTKVLNALAGKLYYNAYINNERNLSGIVSIGDGLTASSYTQAIKGGSITFDSTTGQGSYIKPVKTEFTTTLTGDAAQDSEYADGDIIAADGSYSFKQDSKITTNNAYAINTSKDTVIKADKTLTLTTTGGSAAINTANKLDITAGKLSITTTSNNGGLNAGTTGRNASKATVNINGDIDINANNKSDVTGINAIYADIDVNGNLKAEISSEQGGYSYTGASAVLAQGSSVYKYTSNINLNRNIDITADGNGLRVNGNGATITVKGDSKITVNDTNSRGYSALRADNGTINMNVALTDGKATEGLGKEVILKGNIAATNGTSDGKASVINLALDTKDSSLEGVSYTAANNSEINLWLQNGASWTNEVHGATEKDWQGKAIFTNSNVTRFVGGAGEETAGNIFQKDSNKLTIGSYSGYTNIFYAHEGNGEAEANYTAGDTIITSAAAGSVVNLITDNTNVNMKSEDSVNNVLNSLAGKLTYSNYVNDENNLTGYVKIADGLTASSVTKQTGDIEFNKETGKGSLKADSVKPGVPDPDEQQTDKFDQAITGDDKLYKRQGVLKNGVYIFTKNPTEITVADGAAIDASTMDIVIDSSKAKLVMNGKDAGINADSKKVTISGTTEINGATGLNAANGAQITLKDGTTITGEQQAILADNAKVKLTGGSANTVKGDIFVQNGGNISINSELQAATTTIKGDVLVEDASADIALVGVHSKMNGGYALSGDKSKLTMTVKDGATWNVTSMEGTGLNLIGGATKGGSGYIVMPGADGVAAQSLRTTPANLDIANYQGWETIIYAHNNDGDEVSDYTAGDTIIRKAQAGSGVVLSTDNANINMEDKASVEATLKALAQKVTYSDHAANGKNLTGQVQIADGLTSSSASQYLGTMSWDQNGKGQYDLNSINWSAITEGDYETFVMKGVRSAATTSLHSWRDNMQDTYTGADLADEDGIFAKALGGKTSSDVKGVHDNNTYYGVQVGYDKALNDGWHTGVAFDYRDGDSKYLLSGEGDNQLYSLGVYGVKKFANDSFFRVAAKVGRVENEYDVYNEIRSTKLHGDYKANAYGLTMEYGKTIGKEEAYVTPKVQLTWSQVGSKSYTAATEAGAKLNVDQDSYQSIVGRLGFETGVKSSKGSVYAGFYAAHEFNGDISASYMAKDGGLKHTSFDGEDTWMEMSVGGRYSFNDNCHLYADFARDFNGDFQRKWKANVGLRFEF